MKRLSLFLRHHRIDLSGARCEDGIHRMIQLFQTAKYPNSNVCFLAVGGLFGLHTIGKSFPPSFGVGLQCLVQCRPRFSATSS